MFWRWQSLQLLPYSEGAMETREIILPRPAPNEYSPIFEAEIALVPDGTAFCGLLAAQLEETRSLITSLGEDAAGLRYAPGKWTVRETVGHLADCERVLSYRMLRFLRGDATVLSRSGSSNSGSSSGSSDSDSSQSVSSPGDSSSGSSSGSGSQSFGSSASILSGKVFTTPASEASDGSSSFDAAKSLEELYVKRHIGLIEPAANGDLDFDRAATPASALSLKLGDTAEKMMERMLPQGAVEKVNRECPAKLCTRSDACPFDGGVCCRSAKFCRITMI